MLNEPYKQVKEISFLKSAPAAFLKAVFIALGFTMLVFAIFSFILAYTGLSESAIPLIATVTCVISVILAGLIASKSAKSRGYLNGALAGMLYVAFLYVISLFIMGHFYFNAYILILLAIGLFGGAAGGIWGINLSVKRKHYQHGGERRPIQRRTT